MSVHKWAERYEAAEREVDALRARVRTLEGALTRLHEATSPVIGSARLGPSHALHADDVKHLRHLQAMADSSVPAFDAARSALSGAQPASPAQAPKRKPTEADGFRRRCTVCNQMADECACPTGAQPDTALDSTKSQLDEMRPGPEELARFWDEWALKDGNSPGYNNQKAKNYGAQANAFRLRAESAESALAEREASIVELRRALGGLCRLHERPRMNPPECPCALCEDARAALAQPAPQAALRAMLMKVAREVELHPGDTHEAIVDAVLGGES